MAARESREHKVGKNKMLRWAGGGCKAGSRTARARLEAWRRGGVHVRAIMRAGRRASVVSHASASVGERLCTRACWRESDPA
eukprot:6182774-Pleurochrysis_carterae.AAC.1